jgi:hypothetical protein
MSTMPRVNSDDFYRDIEDSLDRDAEREPYRASRRLTDDDYRERMLLAAGSAFVCDYDEDRQAQDDRIAARNERADADAKAGL